MDLAGLFFGLVFRAGVLVLMVAGGGAAGVAVAAWLHLSRDLPDHEFLASHVPPVMGRIYANDGSLQMELARERRLFIPVAAIPAMVRNAFIAAEDKNFLVHGGIDPAGILRAAISTLSVFGSGQRAQGASTITQQVAKNFLVGDAYSIVRKVREMIVAMRIEGALDKDRILELYLNQIYLGGGAYGVAAAALHYFGKSLDQLEPGEIAYLAALPKAPNNYHPVRNRERAIARRNYVLGRMAADGYISAAVAAEEEKRPLVTVGARGGTGARRDWFAEEVRRELVRRYGAQRTLEDGMVVHTSMRPELQSAAVRALRKALLDHDRRGAYRGAVGRVDLSGAWREELEETGVHPGAGAWEKAVILARRGNGLVIAHADPDRPEGMIRLDRDGFGDQASLRTLKAGDVVLTEPVSGNGKTQNRYYLRQVPLVNGALVAMDPGTGRVLAMVGGFDFASSRFNRATQALRQPGSVFKPFVFATALENGYTPSSPVLDAPWALQLADDRKWRPANYDRKFMGVTTLRVALENSRNLVAVRLGMALGLEKVSEFVTRIGLYDRPLAAPSALIGSVENRLVDMVAAYAVLANGGKQVEPVLIDRIQDRWGRTILRADGRNCHGCGDRGQLPVLDDGRRQVMEPRIAYQMTSLLEGVVQRGTGGALRPLDRPVAGKTGTSNDFWDSWFIGYTPDIVAGVYIGYDEPRSLGRASSGGALAAPVVAAFLEEGLADIPPKSFPVPPGLSFYRVDARTGQPPLPGSRNPVILEPFQEGTSPATPVPQGLVLHGDTTAEAPPDDVPAPATTGTAGGMAPPSGELPAEEPGVVY